MESRYTHHTHFSAQVLASDSAFEDHVSALPPCVLRAALWACRMLAANALEGAVELGAADEEELDELLVDVLDVRVAVALAVVGELLVVELERVDDDDREVVLLDLEVVEEELLDDEVVVGRTGARVLAVEVNALLRAGPRIGASRLEVSMLLSGAPRTGARVCLLLT